MKDLEELKALLPYGSPAQVRAIQAVIDANGVMIHAAKASGIDDANLRRAIRTCKAKAARQNFKHFHNKEGVVPDGYHLHGTSTLYDDEGKPKLQWVKTSVDRERQKELLEEAIKAMCDDLPKIPKTSGPKHAASDLMAVYPLGDPHIGMRSWAEETGEDWDLAIAENAFCKVFDRLVKTAPSCEQAVIINLGDYFHYDNMEGVTSRSKHSLDVDGRYAKMVNVGVKIIRQMITSALEHHKSVRIINAIGNHDDTGAIFLSVCLANMYEKEPRVIVDKSPAPFHYVQFGKCMFGVHHGHTCKMPALPGVMASDRPQMWGETDFRYWYTGHIHHDSMKEFPGVKVESFRTLAAKDAYAAWNGYRSGQDSKCLVLHKDYGEVERHTVNIAILRDSK